jgi:hypothetical protein
MRRHKPAECGGIYLKGGMPTLIGRRGTVMAPEIVAHGLYKKPSYSELVKEPYNYPLSFLLSLM